MVQGFWNGLWWENWTARLIEPNEEQRSTLVTAVGHCFQHRGQTRTPEATHPIREGKTWQDCFKTKSERDRQSRSQRSNSPGDIRGRSSKKMHWLPHSAEDDNDWPKPDMSPTVARRSSEVERYRWRKMTREWEYKMRVIRPDDHCF